MSQRDTAVDATAKAQDIGDSELNSITGGTDFTRYGDPELKAAYRGDLEQSRVMEKRGEFNDGLQMKLAAYRLEFQRRGITLSKEEL